MSDSSKDTDQNVPAQDEDHSLREELVAYLDGELTPELRRSLEQRLASDPHIRTELRSLDQAWNVLDELPQTATDDRFTRSTIEMITVTAEQELKQSRSLPTHSWKNSHVVSNVGRYWRVAVVCCGIFAATFFLASLGLLREERQFVTSLPIVANLDALGQVQSLAFLQELADLNPDWLRESESEATDSDPSESFLFEANRQQRRRWTEQQSAERKAELASAHDRLRGLSEKQRQTRQNVYEQLRASPDRTRLAATLVAYQGWLSDLPAGTQAELRELPADRRLTKIRALTQAENRYRRQLSSEEARALQSAIKEASQSPVIVRFREDFQKRMRQRQADAKRPYERERLVRFERSLTENPAWSVLGVGRIAVAREMPARVMLGPDWQEKQTIMLQEWNRIEKNLLSALSDEHQRRLQQDSSERRIDRLRQWVIEAMKESFEKQDLESFVESDAISNDKFGRLMAEPTSEMLIELRQLYVDRELNAFDPLDGKFQRPAPSLRRGPDRRGVERRGSEREGRYDRRSGAERRREGTPPRRRERPERD